MRLGLGRMVVACDTHQLHQLDGGTAPALHCLLTAAQPKPQCASVSAVMRLHPFDEHARCIAIDCMSSCIAFYFLKQWPLCSIH